MFLFSRYVDYSTFRLLAYIHVDIHVECAKCVDVLNYKNINIYKLYGLTQLFINTIGSSIDVVQYRITVVGNCV